MPARRRLRLASLDATAAVRQLQGHVLQLQTELGRLRQAQALRCCICHDTIELPVALCDNHHLVCGPCASAAHCAAAVVVRTRDYDVPSITYDETRYMRCPICRDMNDCDELITLQDSLRMLYDVLLKSDTQVPCDNHGCPAQSLAGIHRAKHFLACEFRRVGCGYCGTPVLLTEVGRHLNVCTRLQCTVCIEAFPERPAAEYDILALRQHIHVHLHQLTLRAQIRDRLSVLSARYSSPGDAVSERGTLVYDQVLRLLTMATDAQAAESVAVATQTD